MRPLLALICEFGMLSAVVVDSVLHLASERLDKSLNWPGCCVTKGADSVAFNLVRELLEHINLGEVCVSDSNSVKDINHPSSSLPTRSALSTTLVLIELGESEDGIDNVSLLVHNDDGGGTETTLSVFKVVEIHQGFVALFFGQAFDGGATWDDGLQVVPSTDDTLAMSFNQFSERNTHLFLDGYWVINVTRNTEQLCSCIVLSAETIEPTGASSHDGWHDRDGLDVGDGGWATIETGIGWEWGLQSWSTWLTLKRLDKR